MGTNNIAPVVWCLLAAALFGASTPIAKTLLGSFGPLSLAGLLYAGAAAGVLPLALRGGSAAVRWQRPNLLRMAGVVVSGGILAPVLLLLGLTRAPAGSVSLWLNAETPATAVLAALFFREHLGGRTWAALGVVSVASGLIAWPAGIGAASAAVLVALACVCWGIDNNLAALIDGFTPAQSTLVKGIAAGLVNAGLGLWFEPSGWSASAVALALAVGAVSYGLSLVLHVAGAQHLGAARAQLIFASAPFWGVGLAWTIWGEPWTGAQLAAAGLMIVALWLMHGEEHEHRHVHAAMRHTHWHRHDDAHHEHAHDGLAPSAWHIHEHLHGAVDHAHDHAPDLHHRHPH